MPAPSNNNMPQATTSSSQSAKSKQKQKVEHHQADPFFGHADVALLSEFVINGLFSPASPSNGGSKGAAPSGSGPSSIPRLAEYIAYALYRTCLRTPILFSALLLLKRLKTLYPSARASSSSPHRLITSAMMLASKQLMDETFSSSSWLIVARQGGMTSWTVTEINQMERELFGFLLKGRVAIQKEELEEFEHECRTAWASQQELERRQIARGPLDAFDYDDLEDEEDEDEEEYVEDETDTPETCVNRASEGHRHALATTAAHALLQSNAPRRTSSPSPPQTQSTDYYSSSVSSGLSSPASQGDDSTLGSPGLTSSASTSPSMSPRSPPEPSEPIWAIAQQRPPVASQQKPMKGFVGSPRFVSGPRIVSQRF